MTCAFGTYRLSGSALKSAVQQAYTQFGMRDFDTAQLYENEALLALTLQEIRDAETAGGVAHTPIHITTKLSSVKANAMRSLEMSLERLSALKTRIAGDTVTVLLHWPMPIDSWRHLEHALDERLIDRIGVSNYSAAQLRQLAAEARHLPHCNQIELHPFVPSDTLQGTLAACVELGVGVHAHTVLGKGELFQRPSLARLVPVPFSTAQILIAFAKQCGATRLCLSSMRRAHVGEWFASVPPLSADVFEQLGMLGRLEPVEFYGSHSRNRHKAAVANSTASQHTAFLKLESCLQAPEYEQLSGKEKKSSGVRFASMRHQVTRQVEWMARSLVEDIGKFCDGKLDGVDTVSDFAIKVPSISATPNLLLLCAQRLFFGDDALCPSTTMTLADGEKQETFKIKRFTSETLKRKHKGNIEQMDRSLVSHLREVLRLLRASYLSAQRQRDLQKRANKKSHLFCTIKRIGGTKVTAPSADDAIVSDDGEAASQLATLTIADSLTRPFSDAVRYPTAMPVTVSSASEFADFFRDIRTGTPTVLDAASLVPVGPTCTMKKKTNGSCALKKTDTVAVAGAVAAAPSTACNSSKGTFFADGRVDVCKQVVGSQHIADLCCAVEQNATNSGGSIDAAACKAAENAGKGTFFADGRVDVCKQVVGSSHIDALCQAVSENAKGTFFADGRIDVCKQVVGSTHIDALCAAVQQNAESTVSSASQQQQQPQQQSKGTFFGDGRVDVCKQVVGSTHVGALCDAVCANNAAIANTTTTNATIATKARHFLLGNNIACQSTVSVNGKEGLQDDDTSAGFSIASLMASWKTVPIETFYLAGNCIGPNCAALFASALSSNEACNALWLKRNPIGSALGPRSLGTLLSLNSHLRVLDLDNCGLFDDGVREFANAACHSATAGHLQYLYLDANGITLEGARHLAPFLRLNKNVLRGFYVSLNRLGSAGAIEIAAALDGSKSLRVLNLDSNSLRNDGLAPILERYARSWPELEVLSVGYYKSWKDMGESVNFIGAELYEVSGERIAIDQNGVSEQQILDRLVDFLAHGAPKLKVLSVKGNCFSHESHVRLAEAAWKRPAPFDFDNKQLFQPMQATPLAPEIADRLLVQRIKHGELIVNIDSIYRNKM